MAEKIRTTVTVRLDERQMATLLFCLGLYQGELGAWEDSQDDYGPVSEEFFGKDPAFPLTGEEAVELEGELKARRAQMGWDKKRRKRR